MSFQTATLDVFDDRGGILRTLCPTRDSLPEAVKTAAATSRDQVPQSEFAVVLVEDGVALPRFPLSDEGHTVMSVLYFGQTHDRLPEEAQKVAAARLAGACQAYGLGTPTLLRDLAGDLGWCDPVVHVRDDEPVKVAEAPVLDRPYALGDRYPLGTVQEIKSAQRYFEEHLPRFTPEMRHEFAVNVASASESAGLAIPPELAKHAGVTWNPGLQTHLDTRRYILREREAPVDHLIALEKLASAVGNVDIEEFAEAFLHFDRTSGLDASWGAEIYDPVEATFTKLARSTEVGKTWQVGTENVTEFDLRSAAERSVVLLAIEETFGVTSKENFAKDPIAFFTSLPERRQVILARIVCGR